MLFSYEWLKQYADLGDDVESVSQRLTDAGFAVELIEEVEGDRVLDLDITTNRPDCMNHFGLAREAAALLGVELRTPSVDLGPSSADDGNLLPDLVTIDEPDLCRRYNGILIDGVTIGESPAWLRRRLEAIGLRPINNVVDITNYVLWEYGQPLHAYDFETLEGQRIVVRRAAEGESLETLDGEIRALDPEMLIIADAQRAIGLGGIMGGAETEVRASTTRILLEGAWFEPRSIRRTARRLGMHTDASHRFERAVDLESGRAAVERAAALIIELAGGYVVGQPVDARGTDLAPVTPIFLSHDRLEGFSGVEIPRAEVASLLAAIGFEVEAEDAGWLVTPPSWRRFDVVEVADLYEEVLRTIGFDRVPSALPPSDGPDAPEAPMHALRRQLRHRLAAAGYAEVINYAFYGQPENDLLLPLFGDRPTVELENPLSDRYRWMRRTLLPGVIDCARFNRRRNLPAARLFEVGHVFWREDEGQTGEREHLAIVLGGRLGNPWERATEFDLFDLKGAIEMVSEAFGVRLTSRATPYPGLLPGVAAQMLSGDQVVGLLGELDEGSSEAYPLFVAELDLECLLPLPEPLPVQVPSKHPGVAVDFTLTHPTTISYAEIAAAIDGLQVEDLTGFELEARYQGKGVPAGSVNTTIHFLYNAEQRTLTQEEVNERQTRLSDFLSQKFGSGG